MITAATKRCSLCKEEKTSEHFHRHNGRPRGLTPRCKECRSRSRVPLRYIAVTEQTCGECGQLKAASEFWTNASRLTRLNRRCKECSRIYTRGISKKTTRNGRLRRRFGITNADYDQLLLGQDGRCAICRTPSSRPHKHFSVDHCHVTGKVRGLLCHKCNSGIGYFSDKPSVILIAVAYLIKHGATNANRRNITAEHDAATSH